MFSIHSNYLHLISRLVDSDEELRSAAQAVNRYVNDVKQTVSTTPLSTRDVESLSADRNAGEKARSPSFLL
jgi:ABC-type transporter Mla subunit MlaD